MKNYELPLLLALLAVVLLYVRLYRRYRKNMWKVTYTFDAIDNLDFSFNFPTAGVDKDSRLINASLNRIRQILKSARDEALEREKYYEQIINSVDTGIMVVDDRGNVLQHNEALLRLVQADVLTHVGQIKGMLESNSLSKKETRATLKGKHVRIVAVSDITGELNNAEVDSWVKLTRVLTHEMMNTVTPIASLSETLLQKAENPEVRRGLDTICKTGHQLIGFVDSYRRFTHVPKPEPRLFYVKPFLERMQQLARTQAEAQGKSVDIGLDVEPADLLVYADETLIAHVATNILKNAVEAVSQQGNMAIRAYTGKNDAVVIDLSNDGPPIPADVAAHIFVPFFTTKPDGSGIGLSMSKQIMRMSGGTLELARERQTTFRLTFL